MTFCLYTKSMFFQQEECFKQLIFFITCLHCRSDSCLSTSSLRLGLVMAQFIIDGYILETLLKNHTKTSLTRSQFLQNQGLVKTVVLGPQFEEN